MLVVASTAMKDHAEAVEAFEGYFIATNGELIDVNVGKSVLKSLKALGKREKAKEIERLLAYCSNGID